MLLCLKLRDAAEPIHDDEMLYLYVVIVLVQKKLNPMDNK